LDIRFGSIPCFGRLAKLVLEEVVKLAVRSHSRLSHSEESPYGQNHTDSSPEESIFSFPVQCIGDDYHIDNGGNIEEIRANTTVFDLRQTERTEDSSVASEYTEAESHLPSMCYLWPVQYIK
jgi:hypothetical protein